MQKKTLFIVGIIVLLAVVAGLFLFAHKSVSSTVALPPPIAAPSSGNIASETALVEEPPLKVPPFTQEGQRVHTPNGYSFTLPTGWSINPVGISSDGTTQLQDASGNAFAAIHCPGARFEEYEIVDIATSTKVIQHGSNQMSVQYAEIAPALDPSYAEYVLVFASANNWDDSCEIVAHAPKPGVTTRHLTGLKQIFGSFSYGS